MKNAETQIPATPAAQEKTVTQPQPWSDLHPVEREYLERTTKQPQAVSDLSPQSQEFLRLFRAVDPEAQNLIAREVILLAIFGTPFFEEIKDHDATDRKLMRETIEKWEARMQAEAQLEPVKT